MAPTLNYEDYTVGWICALPLEATAAMFMLDQIHEGNFPWRNGQETIYTAGSINGRNIAIACLPKGEYAVGAAARVASQMRLCFPNLALSLMVGIGAGVPGPEHDIRLGDVVVGTPEGTNGGVVQYDLGKETIDGFQLKGWCNATDPVLRSAIGKIESQAAVQGDIFVRYLKMFDGNDTRLVKFQRPGPGTDRLYDASNPTEVIQRNERPHGNPEVHYGLIASGNKVIKNATLRDELRDEHGIICFEMEAAGLMNTLPVAVIRGISDYADSHKNNDWQPYAAAAAAAYARGLLDTFGSASPRLPISASRNTDGTELDLKIIKTGQVFSAFTPDSKVPKLTVADCLRSLSFRSIDARKDDIAVAHRDTCDWLFTTLEFRQWRDGIDLPSHNGVLWIKGNPGAGKSTLMKHALSYCQERFKGHVNAVYFFNARGDALEKTPLGMMRSLMYQLLDQNSDLSEHFVPRFLDKRKKHGMEWDWELGELKTFLLSEYKKCQPQPTVLLIDALDECKESEVRGIVNFLEDLSKNAVGSQSSLKICLSSRHYPTIGIQKKLELILENQGEHDQDIVKYVKSKLRVTDRHIEKEILEKAQHIFLWVVLVVEMLNIAYDEGQIRALQKKLREIPNDLDEIFWNLLQKNNSSKQATVLIFQWVLFAFRQLTPEELYFAVLAGTESEELTAWDRQIINNATIQRYITTTSKGLVEVRKVGDKNTVQFIHESVKDFLLRNGRLQRLDPTLEAHAIGVSHDRLACACMSYIIQTTLNPTFLKEMRIQRLALTTSYPFLEYASTEILAHANIAQASGISQQLLLSQISEYFGRLMLLHDTFEENSSSRYEGAHLLYVVSLKGYAPLVQLVLSQPGVDVNAEGGFFGNTLHAAAWRGNQAVVALLLNHGADATKRGRYGTILQEAAWRADEAIMSLLIEHGAEVNMQRSDITPILQELAWRGDGAYIALLLKHGADINAQGGYFGSALQAAIFAGDPEIVKMLLEQKANVESGSGHYDRELRFSSQPVRKLLGELGVRLPARKARVLLPRAAVAVPEKRFDIFEHVFEQAPWYSQWVEPRLIG